MNSKMLLASCGLVMASLLACGGQSPSPASPNMPSAMPSAPEAKDAFEAQVAEGQRLYAANCASCHGDSGEGGKAPRVVGVADGALPLDPPSDAQFRKTQFRTAADIAQFVVTSMPPGEAGKLTEEEYWAILAFDLKANGVTLEKRLDAESAPSVVIHP